MKSDSIAPPPRAGDERSSRRKGWCGSVRAAFPLFVSITAFFLALPAVAAEKSEDGASSPVLVAVEAEDAFAATQARPRVGQGAAGRMAMQTAGDAGATLHLRFVLPEAGVYRAWIRARAETATTASIRIDGGEAYPCPLSAGEEWTWSSPPRTAWRLEAGERVLGLALRGPVRIDRILLARSTKYTPTGRGPAADRFGAGQIAFDDHFQRVEDETDEWTRAAGRWTITTFYEKTDPRKAANAFTFVGASGATASTEERLRHPWDAEWAVATVGDPLWRDYAGEVSTRSLGPRGRLGVVWNYRDEENHLRAILPVGASGGTVRLLRRENGEETLLAARPGRLRPRQWVRLRAETWRGRIRLLVDGHLLFEAEEPTLLAGRFGLLAQAEEGMYFDDVRVASLREVRPDPEPDPAHWSGLDRFRIETGGADPVFVAPGAAPSPLALGPAPTLETLLTGETAWEDYTLRARVATPVGVPGGLAAAVGPDGEGVALLRVRRNANDPKTVYLLRRLGGDRAVLDRAERREASDAAPRLALALRDGVVKGRVEGTPLVSAYLGREATRGRAGLAVAGGGVRVEELSVRFGEREEAAPATNTIFLHDSYMHDWASVEGEWDRTRRDKWGHRMPDIEDEKGRPIRAKRNVAWNRRDFFGNVSVGFDLPPTFVNAGGPAMLELYLDGDGEDPASGYRLRVLAEAATTAERTLAERGEAAGTAGATGASLPARVRLALFRHDTLLGETGWTLRPHRTEADSHLSGSERHDLPVRARFELARFGRTLRVRQDGVDALVRLEPSAPVHGVRLGAGAFGFTMDVNRIHATSDHLFNDVFTTAAVDWRRDAGDWRMKNRFTCQPQWSWMGGRSKEVAILWQKDRFPGDFTFDVYTSMQMDANSGMHYLRPGFMNITVCADGADLASGYSFVYGAEDGRRTEFWRGRERIAIETRPEALPPMNIRHGFQGDLIRRLHRRWWHWRLEKRGPRLRYYHDGVLLFEYTDPDPLEGDRVAIWTEHRGIMLSRARISYAAKGAREFPLLPPLPPPPAPHGAPPPPDDTIAYRADFERDTGGWASAGRDGSARLRRVEAGGTGATERGLVLRLENPVTGGDAGAVVRFDQPVDLLRHPGLAADLRLGPDAVVDLHAMVRRRVVPAPAHPPYAAEAVAEERETLAKARGETDAPEGDGGETVEAWFTLRLNGRAGDYASDIYPGSTERPGRGTRPFRTLGEAGVTADGAWHRVETNLGDAILRRWREIEAGVPDALPLAALAVANLDLRDLRQSGFYGNRAGSFVELDRVRLFRAPEGEGGGALTLRPAGPVGGDGVARLRVRSGSSGAPWLDTDVLAIEWENAAGGREAAAGTTLATAVRAAPAENRLAIDLLRLGVPLVGRETVTLHLHGLRRRGEADAAAEATRLSLAVDPTLHSAPPRLLTVEAEGQAPPRGEEYLLPRPEGRLRHLYLLWSPEGMADRGSLRLLTRHGGNPMRAPLLEAIDVTRYPVLAWAWKAEPGIRLDYYGEMGALHPGVPSLADGESIDPKLGAVGNTGMDDGRWRRVLVDVGGDIGRNLAFAPEPVLRRFGPQDVSRKGTPDGVGFYVDDLTAYPFLRAAAGTTIALRLHAATATPLTSIRYALLPFDAPAPDFFGPAEGTPGATGAGGATDPPGTRGASGWSRLRPGATGATLRLPAPPDGLHVLHWAAQNAAGWRIAPPHPLPADRTAPTVPEVSPGDGELAAPAELTVRIEESGFGLEPGAMHLRFAEKKLKVKGPDEPLGYDPQTGTVRLRCTAFPRRRDGAVGDDGETLPMRLEGRDLAGNSFSRTWSWVLDYAKDTTPPPVPFVWWMPAEGYVRFPPEPESGPLPFHTDPQKTRQVWVQEEQPGRGRVLHLSPAHTPNTGHAEITRKPIDLRKGLRLHFAYRNQGRIRLDFRFFVDGEAYVLQFLPLKKKDDKVFGQVSNAPYTGAWRTVDIDVATPLLKALPEGAEPIVEKVLLGTPEFERNHPRHWLRLDEFVLYSDEQLHRGGVDIFWERTEDPTGVRYGLRVDDKPHGGATEGFAIDYTRRHLSALPAKKTVAHLTVRDGAGNGATRHLPLPELPLPPPSAEEGEQKNAESAPEATPSAEDAAGKTGAAAREPDGGGGEAQR